MQFQISILSFQIWKEFLVAKRIKFFIFSKISLIAIFLNVILLLNLSTNANAKKSKVEVAKDFTTFELNDYSITEQVNVENDEDYNQLTEVEDESEISLQPSAKSNQLMTPYVEEPFDYRRVCIYPNWSILRESTMARILPEDIDPNLCTHIHYAYANIDVRTFELMPSQFQDTNSGDHGEPLYERIIKLRELNPKLKVLISIGGWFAKSTPFNRILTSDSTRDTFIQQTLNFLKHWKFDGLDIQWEYPGALEYGATTDSKDKFAMLVKFFNKAFNEEYKASQKRYLLTAFVPSEESRIDAGYHVKPVCKYLDYVSVATYDYTGPYDSKTGYNSPLYSRSQSSNSVNDSVYFWLERGCPNKKILVGVSTYARAFKIIKRPDAPNLVYLGIESEPFVSPSLYTSEEGILSYYEVCEMMTNKETKVYWDDTAEVPFAIVSTTEELEKNGEKIQIESNLWVSYEDAQSARKKAEYVKKMSLGGVSIWSLDMDDFKGWFCNLGPFPIIESIKSEFEHKAIMIPEKRTSEETEAMIQPTEPMTIGSTKVKTSTTQTSKTKSQTKPETQAKTPKTPFKNPSSKTDKFTKRVTRPNGLINNQFLDISSTVIIDSRQDLINNGHNINKSNANTNEVFPSINVSSIVRDKLKRFKAVREIKLIACLDKRKCHLKMSRNSMTSLHRLSENFLLISFLALLTICQSFC